MLQWFYFAIISMVFAVLSLLLWKSQKQNSSNLNLLATMTERQLSQNQTLTNLLLAKDSMTFQQLQMSTNLSPSQEVVEQVSPMDDATQALFLADRYKQHGLDPASAYDSETVNFAEEFNL